MGLALQGWLGEPLGVVGCAISNIVIGWLACLSGAAYLAWGPLGRRYRPISGWQWPRWTMWRELVRLGLPMGLSNLVEITSFTLVSLFIASLGATVVAGHRIIANISALTYMLPLSLAIATMAAVGQAVGGRDRLRAHATIKAGLILAAGLSTLAGLLLWFATAPLVAAYTDDPAVRAIATSLVIYVAIYQFSTPCRRLPVMHCGRIASPLSRCWFRLSVFGALDCSAVPGFAIVGSRLWAWLASGWPQ